MFQRSGRLISAVISLDCFGSVSALKIQSTWANREFSTYSPFVRYGKSSANAVYLSLLGISSVALLYWSKEKKMKLSRLLEPATVIASDHELIAESDDIPRSKRFNFLAEVVEEVMPTVVHIESITREVGDKKEKVCGSGFIVDERGYVLTNAHVIAKTCSTTVRLSSGEKLPGTVVSVDEVADLALIMLEAKYKRFPVIKFGESSKLRSGEWVLALGSPLALKNTVTSGIVSTVGRTSKELGLKKKHADMEYIQTDAAITHGNFGGPLVNLDGEVIGINTMSLKSSSQINFAVPSQVAQEFISIALRTVTQEKPVLQETPVKRYMGISMMSLTSQLLDSLHIMYGVPVDLEGVLLVRVWPHSPASDAGLQTNDIIVRIDKKPITSSSQVYDMVQKGKPLSIEVVRGQETHEVTVTPGQII